MSEHFLGKPDAVLPLFDDLAMSAVRHEDDRPFDWIRIEVSGIAQTAGSKRAFVNPKTGRATITEAAQSREVEQRKKAWREQIVHEAREAMRGDLWRGPVMMQIVFGLPRPKHHFGTGRNAGQVKASAPPYPDGKPDVDKLSRAIMDALKGVVYDDDARVICKTVSKQFDRAARTVIFVRRVV
jgi:Holliday junction resolvase RusA-like endonuclease